MSRRIEIVAATGNKSKITIEADRVTVKIMSDDINRDLICDLANRCADVALPQTGRGKLSAIDLDRGVIVLYDQGKKVLGYLLTNEQPVRFMDKRKKEA